LFIGGWFLVIMILWGKYGRRMADEVWMMGFMIVGMLGEGFSHIACGTGCKELQNVK